MDDRKFNYTPAIVSNNPTHNGIERLSLILETSTNSNTVVIADTNNEIIIGILKRYKIDKVVIKNA